MVNNIAKFGSAQRSRPRPARALGKSSVEAVSDSTQDNQAKPFYLTVEESAFVNHSNKKKDRRHLEERLARLKAQIEKKQQTILKKCSGLSPSSKEDGSSFSLRKSTHSLGENAEKAAEMDVQGVTLDTKYVVGQCVSMCPEEETERRAKENNIHILEQTLERYPKQLHEISCLGDYERTIKALTRSSAGMILNKPHLVRTEGCLWATLQYIWKYILDIDSLNVDNRFTTVFVFGFISDRTRSIRKDFSLQGYLADTGPLTPLCVSAFEEICRFHLLADYLLCENEKNEGHDEVLNVQETNKCLKAIIEFYDRARANDLGDDFLKNEEEFRSYFLLLQLQSVHGSYLQISTLLKSWHNDTGYHMKSGSLALEVVLSYYKKDYISLFSILTNDATNLFVAILIHPLLVHIWKFSLEIVIGSSKSYQQYDLDTFLQRFCIESVNQLQRLAMSIGYIVSTDENLPTISFSLSNNETSTLPIRCHSTVISEKLEKFSSKLEMVKTARFQGKSKTATRPRIRKKQEYNRNEDKKKVVQIVKEETEQSKTLETSAKTVVATFVPHKFQVSSSPTPRTIEKTNLIPRKRSLERKKYVELAKKKPFLFSSRFEKFRFDEYSTGNLHFRPRLEDLVYDLIVKRRYFVKFYKQTLNQRKGSWLARICGNFIDSGVWTKMQRRTKHHLHIHLPTRMKGFQGIAKQLGRLSIVVDCEVCPKSVNSIDSIIMLIEEDTSEQSLFEQFASLKNMSNRFFKDLPMAFVVSGRSRIIESIQVLGASHLKVFRVFVAASFTESRLEDVMYEAISFLCESVTNFEFPSYTVGEIFDIGVQSMLSVTLPSLNILPFFLVYGVFVDYIERRNLAINILKKYASRDELKSALCEFCLPKIEDNTSDSRKLWLSILSNFPFLRDTDATLEADISSWSVTKSVEFFDYLHRKFDAKVRKALSHTGGYFQFHTIRDAVSHISKSNLTNTRRNNVERIAQALSLAE